MKKPIFLLFLTISFFTLNSCSLLVAILTPTPTEEIVQNLKLNYDSYKGIFGNTNVSGTIENNNYSTVYDVVIEAKVTSPKGYTTSQKIEINAGIPSKCHIEFKDKIVSYSEDKVDLKIISARF